MFQRRSVSSGPSGEPAAPIAESRDAIQGADRVITGENSYLNSNTRTVSVHARVRNLYYYRRRMQMSLQDLTKISPGVRNSTPIIA